MQDNTREYFRNHKDSYWTHLEHKCYNCGSTTDTLELHHIVPLGLGGTNNPSNIVPLCGKCHDLVHGTTHERMGKEAFSEAVKRGLERARKEGKTFGGVKGKKLITQKSIECKKLIKEYSKSFNGILTDAEVRKICGDIANTTYRKYKNELLNSKDEDEIKKKVSEKTNIRRKIKKYSRHFNGSSPDKDVIKEIGISETVYRRYKNQLLLINKTDNKQ